MGLTKNGNSALQSFCHRTETRVTYADTDAMGVVYYAHYLRWFEMGRSELMRSLGVSYREMEREEIFLPVAELFCKYLVSARYDDVVTIETFIDFLKRASIQFRYRLLRKTDGAILVTGRTLHAFVDREGKVVRIPDGLREKIQI
jgi:acyl-CoA thioester hydrolase